ncbi:MAG: hypothetical protein A3C79_02890 [Candidatus Taylorbacteria bacterium RIFCSPHIGHO2_02_FULL_45_28]|uniref:Uncharacterized protein n=1 Tax=Candidatus Taylorbacteria bacterium RIFCSPHIGHO2_12_FULL_45_16 TaxID=1802315 RepID=A0A1G2N0P4_9BACT|nr:MAG: hypothetical protein A2830_00610 [Candidatus Taylorbacteria bacterium RIFCSPHIGHO2_01_FULL_44_110]OHA24908.1 MAG: hypothetical protein A3C79_02890 [Candidatus Taylorbacteria bacterium RIFCSPHIGHO2_02_FULL_45_28]OHA29726.1 MAG: hypothetical protein A3F51_03305 [Candidatus Taylorbacteria bacterium RIFCSPHIGHO2_12_FULL_45_16]OHA32670.1 MAG: hypothetical protein A3A23_00175 [Candidatus Taylorbacteria bacterium RIFCSPLOWO2_01_FULL_45_59]OHA38825.1 MAG: hypothetical protein A3I98_01615 [Candi
MLNISQFFKKIKGKYSKQIFIRSIVSETIQKHIGIVIPVDTISFSGRNVVINGISQTARSQIFIKKQTILQEINLKQNNEIISDIR